MRVIRQTITGVTTAVRPSLVPEIVFSHPAGQPLSDEYTAPYNPPSSRQFTVFYAALGSTDSVDTVFTIYKNGVAVGSLTVPSGQRFGSANITVSLTGPNVDVLTILATDHGEDMLAGATVTATGVLL